MYKEIMLARVNSIVGSLFLGSFALAAGLIMWHAAFGTNPLAEQLASYAAMQQLSQ